MSSNWNKESSDETNRPRVVEDKPRLQSVAMMSSPPAMTRHAMPPPLKFGSSPPLVKTTSTTVNPKPTPSGPRWRVSRPLVKPSYYEFERTHTTVKGASSVEISQRLDDFFRKASIDATFNNEEVCRAIFLPEKSHALTHCFTRVSSGCC